MWFFLTLPRFAAKILWWLLATILIGGTFSVLMIIMICLYERLR